MEPKFGTRSIEHHSDSIVCKNCGQSGTIIWDDLSRVNSAIPAELVGIDGPFFERLSRKPPYPIEMICRECGGVALTVFPSTVLHDRAEYN